MIAPGRDELRAHLLNVRIAGDVATPRDNNLHNFGRLAARDPHYMFGLEPAGTWTFAEILALMAERCGVRPEPEHTVGQDTIDVDRTLDRLDAMGDRIRRAADNRERVFVGTGHPIGLRPTHGAVARALRTAGCTVLAPAAGWTHPIDTAHGTARATIAYLDEVAVMVGADGALQHTHSPLPMEAVLAQVRRAGADLPDLVLADHGWAGAAGQAGVDSVGFADCNDPALFVGEAEGRVQVCVPLDDNVAPHLYAPLTAYLLARAGLAE
jgi:hypothetical protein